MVKNFTRKPLRKGTFVFSFVFLFVLAFQSSFAQTTFDWLNTAPDGNWRQGAAGARWSGGLWDEPGFGILRFNNNHQLSMTNNVPGTYSQHRIIFGASNTSNRTIGGNTVRLFDNGGADPQIVNLSTGSHTINFNLEGDGAGDPLELNPVSGNLTFGGTINNQGTDLLIFGDNGNSITFNGIISGGGKFVVREYSLARFNAAHSYTGNTEIDEGELWIQASGDITSSSIFLGNGGLAGNVTKFWLSNGTGGTTFSRSITVNNGNATTRVIGGLNSSNTNTYSGGITNNSTTGGLDMEAQSGGTVAFSGVISGGGFISKTGAGTVIFSGTNQNTYTGTTTVAAGTLVLGKSADVRAVGTGGTTINSSMTLRTDANNQFGSTLLTNNGTFNLNNTTQTLALRGNGSTTLGTGSLIINNGGDDTYSGTVSGAGSVTKQGTGIHTFSGILSHTGSGGLTVSAGTLNLTAANTYSGVTTISGGTLSIGTGGTSGTLGSNSVTNNATLNFNRSDNITVSNVISGTGVVTKLGTGNLILSGNNLYTGQTRVEQGELWIGSSSNLASTSGIVVGNVATNVAKFWLTTAGGGTTLTNGFTINNGNAATRVIGGLNTSGTHTYSGNITNNSTTGGLDVEVINAGGTVDFSGVISGAGFVTKTGAGTVIFSGSSQNTYTNTTTTRVAAGTLVFNKTAGVRATGTGTTTVDFGTTLRTDAANQFGSTLLVNNGTFNLNGNNQTLALQGIGSVNLGAGILTIDNTATDTYSGTVTGTTGGIVKQNSGTQILSNNLTGFSGGVSLTGGTLTLSGNNTYTGGTTVSAGQLNINSATAIGGAAGTLTLSGGNIDNTSGSAITLTNNNPQAWNSNFTFVGSNNLNMGTGAVAMSANRTVTVSNNTLRVGGAISGGFALTKAGAGALVLTGANDYTGGTAISAGTLAIGAGGTTGILPAGNVTNNGNLTFDRSDNISISNVISGTGALSKLGAGTLTLTGANTYSGQTNITAGTIQLSGSGTVGDNSDIRISLNASLNLNGVNTTVRSVSEAGTGNGGTIDLGNATLTINGIAGSFFQNSITGTGGSVVKNGLGTLALYGTQSYTGSTTVGGGELSTSVAMSSTNYTISGGTFRIAAANIIPNTAVLNVTGGTLAVDQNETVGDVTLSATSTLNIAAGRTLTINGTLTITPGAAINFNTTGQIAYGPSGRIVFSGLANSGYNTFDAIWPATSGPNSVEVNLTGTNPTVSLHANRTVSGAVTLTSGTLAIGTNTLTVSGTISATSGSLTSAATGTVNYSGANQTVLAASYGNLTLSSSGTKTFAGSTTVAGTLTIASGVVANLGSVTTHTANVLTLGTSGAAAGSWGGSASSASNRNATFFGATATGEIAVSSGTCTNPTAPGIGTITQPTCSVATGSVALTGLPASGTWTVTGSPSGSLTGSGATGTVPGLTANQSYTFTVTNQFGCTSVASASAVLNAQPVTPDVPTISTVAATCSAPGSASISNYNGSLTYVFSPSGPSVGVGGAITGATFGQSYTVTAGNGTCTSASSASFTIGAQITTNTWTGAGGNNLWSNGSNWSCGTAPANPLTVSVTIPAGEDVDLDVNLTIGNSGSLVLATGATGTFTINPGITLTVNPGTADFNGRPVVIRSTSMSTGAIGQIGGTNGANLTDATNVTVERYIPARRAWRAITAPLAGGTNNSIFANWQNTGTGTGVTIWSPAPNGVASPSSANSGLLLGGVNTSILQYNSANNSWTTSPITNTNTTPLFVAESGNTFTNRSYMVFVTGPFSAGVPAITGAATATTLRPTGTLQTGQVVFTGLTAGQFHFIGNPYPSPVNLSLATVAGTNGAFYVWDANGGGLGVYRTWNGSDWVTPPTGSSYGGAPIIQSGQAFLINATSTASVTFNEDDKVSNGTNNVGFRPTNDNDQRLRIRLNRIVNNVPEERDAALVRYDPSYNPAVDNDDIVKFPNFSENLSFFRSQSDLVIERRSMLQPNDTLFLRLWNTSQASYQFVLEPTNLVLPSGTAAVLQDQFLGTEQILNTLTTSTYNFSVTSNAASSGNRFRVVFRASAPTSVRDLNTLKGISVYPNPVVKGSDLQLQFSNVAAGRYEVVVYSVTGEQVMQRSIVHPGGNGVQRVLLPGGLAGGTYIAEIRDQKGAQQKIKVAIQ